MGLEIKRQPCGQPRKYWYGRYKINRKRYIVNLGVEIEGRIPDSLREKGDINFEKSRIEAKKRLEAFKEPLKKQKIEDNYRVRLINGSYEINECETIKQLSNGLTFWRDYAIMLIMNTKHIVPLRQENIRIIRKSYIEFLRNEGRLNQDEIDEIEFEMEYETEPEMRREFEEGDAQSFEECTSIDDIEWLNIN